MDRYVIGLVGAFGSGCTYIAKNFIANNGYHYLSLSDILRDLYLEENGLCPEESLERKVMQDYGNQIRLVKGNNYLAQKAVEKIEESSWTNIVVDSFRNPNEIEYFKSKFIEFDLIGIFSDKDIRWNRVKNKYDENEGLFNKDEKRDKGEDIENGQRVTDCFLLADVIIANNIVISGENDAFTLMKTKINQYIDLLRNGAKGRRPTEIEAIMTMAYANSQRSSCLKRKVGAVIVDGEGNIFSSGYNEVPPLEKPCKNECGQCYRSKFKNEIEDALQDAGILTEPKKVIMKKIKVLEKCRALHAEENAILNVARFGSASAIKNGTLYTTTYPCNLCANKIAKVGLRKVIYLEPYPVEEAKQTLSAAKIEQEAFEGITYNSYFKVYCEIIL